MNNDEFVSKFANQCEEKIAMLKRAAANKRNVNVLTASEKTRMFTVKLERGRLMRKNSDYRNQENFIKTMSKMENVSITKQDVKNQSFVAVLLLRS